MSVTPQAAVKSCTTLHDTTKLHSVPPALASNFKGINLMITSVIVSHPLNYPQQVSSEAYIGKIFRRKIVLKNFFLILFIRMGGGAATPSTLHMPMDQFHDKLINRLMISMSLGFAENSLAYDRRV